jgi:phosphatidate cytidylyltransferase
LGGWILLIGWCAIVALGVREFYHMLAQKGLKPWMRSGMVASVFWCVIVHIYGAVAYLPVFTGLLLLGLSLSLFRGQTGSRLFNVSATLLGVIYVGFLGSFVPLVRNLPPSQWDESVMAPLAVLVLIGVWANDTAAYFSGRWFGHWHPFPNISPSKTEAGFIGGLTATLAVISVETWGFQVLPLKDSIGLGLVVGIGAPLGDLVESMIKRDMGVKDTSTLIPGHGGVLDRFDSIFFVFPLVYLYLLLAKTF